jgi:hypothetical protein
MFPNCKPNVKIKHIISNEKKSVAHFEIEVLDKFSRTQNYTTKDFKTNSEVFIQGRFEIRNKKLDFWNNVCH